jgi:hypothetical protein
MAKAAKKGGFADMDNEEIKPQEAPAVINDSGILYNITFKGVTMTEYKDKKQAGVVYPAAEFLFEDENGRLHKENYFKPKTDPAEIQYPVDKWEKIGEKWTKTRKLSNEEMIKALNNDVMFFLMDLGEALSYTRDNIKATLSKAETFEDAIQLFRDNYPPIKGKNINMKLLWDNNDNKKTSFLKLRVGGQLVYYPFMKKIFDKYAKGVPSSLKLEKYDEDNRMQRKYSQADKAPQEATGTGGEVASTTKSGWAPVKPNGENASGGTDEDWI